MTDRPTWAAAFGQLIAARRTARGLTLDGLGKLLGSHRQTVWRWEHGEQLPDASDLCRFAEALGCSVRSLLPDGRAGVKP